MTEFPSLSSLLRSDGSSIRDRIRIFDRQRRDLGGGGATLAEQSGYERHRTEEEHNGLKLELRVGRALHAREGSPPHGGGEALHATWGGRDEVRRAVTGESTGHGEHEHDILHASLLDRSGLAAFDQRLQALSSDKHRMTRAYYDLYDTARAPVQEAERQDLKPTSSADLIYGDAEALQEHEELFSQVQSTMALIEEELDTDVLQVAANKFPMLEADFNSRTTLGISFVDMEVEDTLVGSPAFLSDEIELGDTLVEVDRVKGEPFCKSGECENLAAQRALVQRCLLMAVARQLKHRQQKQNCP